MRRNFMNKNQKEIIVRGGIPTHGSPQDRGSADRYYGRPFEPHYWENGTGHGIMTPLNHMTPAEITAYTYGYNNEQDRKDWG